MKLFSVLTIYLIISWNLLSAQCVNDIYTGFGGVSADEGQALVADAAENVYFTGVFTESIQLGAFSLTTDSIGQFLCKMSPNGTILWAKTLFNNIDNYFTNFPPILRIDHSGQLVMAGTCQVLNAAFDTIPVAFASGDLFIARFDTATGTLNNFVSTGRHMYAYVYDMDIDNNDNVYLAGSFVGVINFGSISMVCLGQTNSFLAKFNPQNQAQWARRISTTPNTTGNFTSSLNYDNYNHVFVSGWFGLNADFGNGVALNSPVYSNGFLAKYDLSGNIVWAAASDTNTSFNNQVVMDSNSVIVVQNPQSRLIHFDQNGDTTWTKVISNNTYSMFSEFKKFNNQYFGMGTFFNSLLLDGVTYTSPFTNIFIACFNTSGGVNWVRTIPCAYVTPKNMAFDPQSNIYLTGEYGNNNHINQNALPTWGNSEALFVKLCEGATSDNSDMEDETMLNIYPNPAVSFLNISDSKSNSISVMNVMGEIVFEKLFPGTTEEIIQLDVSHLSPGIYFIRTGDQTRKFSKL